MARSFENIERKDEGDQDMKSLSTRDRGSASMSGALI
jgi:hypothetical protein